jgi:hypothetical protein
LQLNWLRASHFFPTGYRESISRFGTQLALIDYVAGVIEDLTDRGARQPCSSFDVYVTPMTCSGHMNEKSALRSCGRDLTEFFKSTEWAFFAKVDTSELPAICQLNGCLWRLSPEYRLAAC